MARKLTMEDSRLRRRKVAERRALIAAGKTPPLGSAMVKATGRDVDMDPTSKTFREARFPTHWVTCNATTSIRRLMRAGRQMRALGYGA